MAEIDNWSTTASSNTTVGGINVAEHCLAANLNDGIRAVMAGVKEAHTTVTSNISTLSSTVSGHTTSISTINSTLTTGITTVPVSGSAIDLSQGSVFTKTISGATTFTITNATASRNSCFSLILTNGGAYTVTWPSTLRWADGSAPDLTSSGVDVISFLSPDGGTTWYGVASALNAKASS